MYLIHKDLINKKSKKINVSITKGITVLSGSNIKELIPKTLMGFKQIEDGVIEILESIIDKNTKDFRYFQSKIGYVFLNPEDFLTNKTIKEEISFGLKYYGFREIEDRINYYFETFKADYIWAANNFNENVVMLDKDWTFFATDQTEFRRNLKILAKKMNIYKPIANVMNFGRSIKYNLTAK